MYVVCSGNQISVRGVPKRDNALFTLADIHKRGGCGRWVQRHINIPWALTLYHNRTQSPYADLHRRVYFNCGYLFRIDPVILSHGNNVILWSSPRGAFVVPLSRGSPLTTLDDWNLLIVVNIKMETYVQVHVCRVWFMDNLLLRQVNFTCGGPCTSLTVQKTNARFYFAGRNIGGRKVCPPHCTFIVYDFLCID